jgi:hypothetical protein
MTQEHYIFLLAFNLLVSALVNVILFVRLDIANKFVRYTRYSMVILHVKLEKLQNEYRSTKGSECLEKALQFEQEAIRPDSE